MNRAATHRETMARYYALHARVYDATRWAFLLGRDAILRDLALQSGETVVEVGCGTGRNFPGLLAGVGPGGRVVGVDCSPPMLARARHRIARRGWSNVQLFDREYGGAPVVRGGADAVLFSYSLSMIPGWREALECSLHELKPGGRIGVVDFCLERRTAISGAFARWMAMNHVRLDRPYREELTSRFHPVRYTQTPVLGGLWTFYRFLGRG